MERRPGLVGRTTQARVPQPVDTPVNKFPTTLKKAMEDWAGSNVHQTPDEQARQTQIEELTRQIEALKRGT